MSATAIGCSAASPLARSQPADDARLARVRTVAAALAPYAGDLRLTLVVLDSDVPGAYSWPDGRIAVTAGLIDALDDAELAAAIAHELGHLLNDGHVRGVAALKGYGAQDDVEAAADRTGVRLLTDAHLPPAAMSRMLTKVKDSPHTSAPTRAPLAARIKRLD